MKPIHELGTAERFRRLMGRYTTGVSVLLAREGGEVVGLTANSLTSVSLEPLLLLFCLRQESASAARLLRVGRFTVNLLAESQQQASRHFAGPRDASQALDTVGDGTHVWLPGSNGVFKCEVADVHPGGDHRIVVARVLDLIGPDVATPPLLYHEGSYARLG
ncbi:MAG: flavin reductase family protein [Pseudomonadota bacterium]